MIRRCRFRLPAGGTESLPLDSPWSLSGLPVLLKLTSRFPGETIVGYYSLAVGEVALAMLLVG